MPLIVKQTIIMTITTDNTTLTTANNNRAYPLILEVHPSHKSIASHNNNHNNNNNNGNYNNKYIQRKSNIKQSTTITNKLYTSISVTTTTITLTSES